MILYSTSPNCSFSDSDNKQSFVDHWALKLANIPGIEYGKAIDDADCLIKALLAAAEYLRCFTVVGDDTDLIVLLLHKTKDIELNTAKLIFRTKKCTGTSLFLLRVLGKSRSWETFSVSTRCIYEGQKSSSDSLKLTQNTGGQLGAVYKGRPPKSRIFKPPPSPCLGVSEFPKPPPSPDVRVRIFQFMHIF